MTLPLFYIMGSKSRMCRDLLPMMLPLMHDVQEYREPFVGAGSIAGSYNEPASATASLAQ